MDISSPVSGDELSGVVGDVVHQVGDRLTDNVNLLRDSAVTARYHSEDFIQNNPWLAVSIATGCGFLLGVLIARR